MKWIAALLLPTYLGLAAVAQGGLNRQISNHWGAIKTTVLNSFVFLAWSLLLYWWAKSASLPAFLRPGGTWSDLPWWSWFPGLLGVTLVVGIPLSIHKYGAIPTFVGMVVAQIIGAACWDIFVEKHAVSATKYIGMLLALGGFLLVTLPGSSK